MDLINKTFIKKNYFFLLLFFSLSKSVECLFPRHCHVACVLHLIMPSLLANEREDKCVQNKKGFCCWVVERKRERERERERYRERERGERGERRERAVADRTVNMLVVSVFLF